MNTHHHLLEHPQVVKQKNGSKPHTSPFWRFLMCLTQIGIQLVSKSHAIQTGCSLAGPGSITRRLRVIDCRWPVWHFRSMPWHPCCQDPPGSGQTDTAGGSQYGNNTLKKYISDDLNLGWLIHYVFGHRMPKPCKAMGNLKSDTPLIHHMILWIVYNMNLFIQQLLMDWRWRRRVVSTCERHPLSPKAPKVEKAMGNLKYWMVL